MFNVDGNLAALAVYEKKQDELAQLEDYIAKRETEMLDEIKAGAFNPERLIELQVIHFENNYEADIHFKNSLARYFKSDKSYHEQIILDTYLRKECFFSCEHVQKQIQEWAEEDLTQEAEDDCNESAAEVRDCEY